MVSYHGFQVVNIRYLHGFLITMNFLLPWLHIMFFLSWSMVVTIVMPWPLFTYHGSVVAIVPET